MTVLCFGADLIGLEISVERFEGSSESIRRKYKNTFHWMRRLCGPVRIGILGFPFIIALITTTRRDGSLRDDAPIGTIFFGSNSGFKSTLETNAKPISHGLPQSAAEKIATSVFFGVIFMETLPL